MARRRGDGFALSGTKLLVGWADAADYFLVTADTGDGVTLFLVGAAAGRISRARLDNIAGGALYEVGFDEVLTPATWWSGR
jgi:alkylation response protein AidB-like acyl-CoA dehydrogenase